MKNNNQKKNLKKPEFDDMDTIKVKKKINTGEDKVNLKSRKFWDEIYEDEDDNFEKLLRE
jgi:hypothetical protein